MTSSGRSVEPLTHKHSQDTDPTPQESQEMLMQMTRIVELTEEQVNSLIGCSGYLKDKLHVGGRFLCSRTHISIEIIDRPFSAQ